MKLVKSIKIVFLTIYLHKMDGMSESSDEFYHRLKEQLLENEVWPTDYLFKFIIPTDTEKTNQISEIFDNTGAVIKSKKSKKGTYTSISIQVNLESPDAVIDKYKEVGKIDGVISL